MSKQRAVTRAVVVFAGLLLGMVSATGTGVADTQIWNTAQVTPNSASATP
ncbi:hypothetical protein [Streptacidiphilus jiangxiensis]|uniref:Uncharacterized protein n=1 Tax=Streptacidiphilus jiangxiensis TaxID=235985 RepID=A0A1H7IAG7_STRJI|nr:hypothetical protein [Streptacidiphilus jiangxiensis]SEK59479.1 hypothetical protein SAMN05414137_102573 [Streptacidiphilus jiangxiensis]